MTDALWIALVLLVMAIVFPIFALKFRPRASASPNPNDDYAELKASILFLNTALPALLFFLGALGFTTYDTVVNRVTREAMDEVKRFIRQETIDSLVVETKIRRDQARADAEIIRALKGSMQGSTERMFLQFLPKGTIVPYFGTRYNFDQTTWALCDGTNGTPDLRDRFVLGATFQEVGDTGGGLQHSHTADIDFDGKVLRSEAKTFPHYDGPATGTKFNLETHNHVFNTTRQKATINGESHLPPFYRLVYLMKIK
jgi:hypothetical protein